MPFTKGARRLLKLGRGALATIVLTALLAVVVPAIFPDGRAEAAAGDQVTARVAVNVRSGPGTSHQRVGVLYRGQTVTARGATSNGWVPITWQGRQAWVSSSYVTEETAGTAKSSPAPASTAANWTTVRLNVRSAPSTSAKVLTRLAKGTQVNLTGQTRSGWTQINYNGQAAWVATRYLASTAPSSTPTPTPAPTPTPTTTPETIGSRWGTVELNLWNSATGSSYASTASKGTEFKITGTVTNGRAQVVWQGAVRWVTAKYLSETAPNALTTSQTCVASYYDQGAVTANGEKFDPTGFTAAHKSLPFGTKVKVTNQANGKSVTVRINDRGPYIAGRCLDLTTAAFKAIADPSQGVATVTYQITN